MNPVADGASQSMLCGVAPQSWIVHRTVEGSDCLRRVFAVGVLYTPHSLTLFENALVCIESISRRVHAFRYLGPALRLEDASMEELGALADAMYDQGLHECSNWSIDYVEGVGCRIPEAHIKPRETGSIRSLRGVTRIRIPPGVGTFWSWSSLPLLSQNFWEDKVVRRAIKRIVGSYSRFNDPHGKPMQSLLAAASIRMEAFISALQPAAIDACRWSGRNSVGAFNAFAINDDQKAHLRAQSAAAFPILGLLCAERSEPDMLAVRLAIDRRLPLIATAAKTFDVHKNVIRFLAGKSIDQLGLDAQPEADRYWIDSPGVVLKALDAIEPDHRPRECCDWLALYHLIGQFDGWHTLPRELVQPFFKDAGRRGLRVTREWMAKRYASDSAIADCQDFVDSFEEVLALADGQMDYLGGIWQFYVPRGMQRLLDDSLCWHRAVACEAASRLSALEAVESEHPSPLPFDVPKNIDEHQVVFLDRSSALVDEGLRMSHCVATLYRSARTGRRLAFSLRTREGRSLASFDISLVSQPWGMEAVLNELRGHKNADVCDIHKQIVSRFLSSVQREVEAHREAVQAWLESMAAAQGSQLDDRFGEILREAKRAAVVEVIGGHVGRSTLAPTGRYSTSTKTGSTDAGR